MKNEECLSVPKGGKNEEGGMFIRPEGRKECLPAKALATAGKMKNEK